MTREELADLDHRITTSRKAQPTNSRAESFFTRKVAYDELGVTAPIGNMGKHRIGPTQVEGLKETVGTAKPISRKKTLLVRDRGKT